MLALLLLPLLAHAAPSADQKAVTEIFARISSTVTDRLHNGENADSAAEMAELLRSERAQVPASVWELAPSDRPKAMAEYRRLLDEEMLQAVELRVALLRDNSVLASDALSAIERARTELRNKFRGL